VFDVIRTVKDGGSARDTHKKGTAFCNPFWSSKGVNPTEIHRRMKPQYGDACVSYADHPSRPHTAYTPERTEPAEQVIRETRENRRVTTDEVAVELGITHGSAHHIMHDVLQYHKVCARWVPKQLTPDLKERRKELVTSGAQSD